MYSFHIKKRKHYVKILNNEIAHASSRLRVNVASINLRSINVKDYALTQQRLAKAISRWKGVQYSFVERNINSSIHNLSAFSPALIIFGNSVHLNRITILEKHHICTKAISVSGWIEELMGVQFPEGHDEINMTIYPTC